MGQEFFINSEELESKIRQLLPSQGGRGAGFDLSASTQIVPIVDLTESAEGSNLRQDLQSSFGLDNINSFLTTNSSTTLITTTGYWRVIGTSNLRGSSTADRINQFQITDGVTTKAFWGHSLVGGGVNNEYVSERYDLIFKLSAGHSFIVVSATNAFMHGSVRQIATIDGELVDPS